MLTYLKNDLTYHHLTKKERGGKASVENGCVANHDAHDFIHWNEHHDYCIYELINESVELYKLCIDEEEWGLIKQWEKEVVAEVKNRLGKSGRQYVNNYKQMD